MVRLGVTISTSSDELVHEYSINTMTIVILETKDPVSNDAEN